MGFHALFQSSPLPKIVNSNEAIEEEIENAYSPLSEEERRYCEALDRAYGKSQDQELFRDAA